MKRCSSLVNFDAPTRLPDGERVWYHDGKSVERIAENAQSDMKLIYPFKREWPPEVRATYWEDSACFGQGWGRGSQKPDVFAGVNTAMSCHMADTNLIRATQCQSSSWGVTAVAVTQTSGAVVVYCLTFGALRQIHINFISVPRPNFFVGAVLSSLCNKFAVFLTWKGLLRRHLCLWSLLGTVAGAIMVCTGLQMWL